MYYIRVIDLKSKVTNGNSRKYSKSRLHDGSTASRRSDLSNASSGRRSRSDSSWCGN
jgi:hypothetical protein